MLENKMTSATIIELFCNVIMSSDTHLILHKILKRRRCRNDWNIFSKNTNRRPSIAVIYEKFLMLSNFDTLNVLEHPTHVAKYFPQILVFQLHIFNYSMYCSLLNNLNSLSIVSVLTISLSLNFLLLYSSPQTIVQRTRI